MVTLVLILFYYLFFISSFFFFTNPFILHPIQLILSVVHRFIPTCPHPTIFCPSIHSLTLNLGLTLSRSTSLKFLDLFLFRVRSLDFLRPPGTRVANCSGVSGALEGPSFQNHSPQRTHQTAYAKRESRCGSVGSRRNLGRPLSSTYSLL